MSKPRATAGKRNVEQHKREKAQAKQARKAARMAIDPGADSTPVLSTEAELIDELAGLHRAVESGVLSPQDFEDGRERIRQQLEQITQQGR